MFYNPEPEKPFHVCPGGYYTDPDTDLCIDDLCNNNPGKGVRHNGGPTCFASASHSDNSGKGDALFYPVVYKCASDTCIIMVCLRTACKGKYVLLLAESMLYILMSLTLGILISTVSATMQQAIFISLIGLMLPTILLSGFIFPIENMPKIYDYVSHDNATQIFHNNNKKHNDQGNRIAVYLERDSYSDSYDNGFYRNECKEV